VLSLQKNGWKVLFSPDAEIIHYGGQTTKQMAEEFLLQLQGSRLIFVKLHRSRLAFHFACFLAALFFFLRVPYWLSIAAFKKNKGKSAFNTARVYMKCGLYCLADWKKLLMNREAIEGKL